MLRSLATATSGAVLLLASACASNVDDEQPPRGRQLPPAIASDEASASAGNRCADIPVAKNLLQGELLPHGEARGSLAVGAHWAYMYIGETIQRVPITGGPAESIYTGLVALGHVVAHGDTSAWLAGDLDDGVTLMVHNPSGLHAVELPGDITLVYNKLLIDNAGGAIFQVSVPNATKSQTWRWNAADQTASRLQGVGMPELDSSTGLYFVDNDQIIWASDTGLYTTNLATAATRLLRADGTDGVRNIIGFDSENIYGVDGLCAKGSCPFTVTALPRSGGPAFQAYQTSESYWTSSVQADASGVYWLNFDDVAIYHASLHDDAPAERVSHVGARVPGWQIPSYFEMDECNLYWSTTTPDGTIRIMAVAKQPSAAH